MGRGPRAPPASCPTAGRPRHAALPGRPVTHRPFSSRAAAHHGGVWVGTRHPCLLADPRGDCPALRSGRVRGGSCAGLVCILRGGGRRPSRGSEDEAGCPGRVPVAPVMPEGSERPRGTFPFPSVTMPLRWLCAVISEGGGTLWIRGAGPGRRAGPDSSPPPSVQEASVPGVGAPATGRGSRRRSPTGPWSATCP